MPGPDKREKFQAALRHPVQWMRGEGLPEDHVRPWEQTAQIVPKIFAGLRNGFTWNTMYMYQEVFKLDKRQQTIADLSTITFDGVNDPIMGAFMDTRNLPIRVHRWIMRIGIVVTTFLHLVPMLDLGLNAGQRIVFFIVFKCLADLFGTPQAVSGIKVFAHVTSNSGQRARMIWASGIGEAIHEMLYPSSMALVGMHAVFGWSQYSVFLVGGAVTSLFAMFFEMAPTFVLQRVPDQPPTAAAPGVKGFLLEMKEAFSIARHNRYLVLDLAARTIGAFTPGMSDWDFYNYCGVNNVMNASKLKGETLVFIRDNIVSFPCNFILPFAIPVIKKLGGPRNTQVVHQVILVVCNLLKWLIGMKSMPGVFANWGLEMLNRVFGKVQLMAQDMNKYDMLDYVEWKTGRRSEGVMSSVDTLMKKLVTNNVDKAVGNLVIDALGFDPSLKRQPAAFLKWAPTLYLLVPAIDNLIILAARLLYKYPDALKQQVEAELVERRKLAEEALELGV